jgi:hypothetical protein
MNMLIVYSRIGTATSFHRGLIRTGVGEFLLFGLGSYVRV